MNSCLYHTFRILLFRPMLTRRGKPEGTTSTQKHGYLVECVTSATSIISIFDLFCRTFSMNYCVLSLAYSVYIAASVFLLQVQAAPDDQQAMSRLSFCIQGLQQVKTFSPGETNSNFCRLVSLLTYSSHWQCPESPHEGAFGSRHHLGDPSTSSPTIHVAAATPASAATTTAATHTTTFDNTPTYPTATATTLGSQIKHPAAKPGISANYRNASSTVSTGPTALPVSVS